MVTGELTPERVTEMLVRSGRLDRDGRAFDTASVPADPRAHRAARVAPDVMSRSRPRRAADEASRSVPATGSHEGYDLGGSWMMGSGGAKASDISGWAGEELSDQVVPA